MKLNFFLTRRERELVNAIAIKIPKHRREEAKMHIVACHCNGCPLDLEAMADPKNRFSVVLDVGGIMANIHPDTAKLLNGYVPIYKKEAQNENQ